MMSTRTSNTNMMSEDWQVVNGWLIGYVGTHTCAGGTVESNGLHEPYCGWEPYATVENILNDYVWLRQVIDIAKTEDMDEWDARDKLNQIRTILNV